MKDIRQLILTGAIISGLAIIIYKGAVREKYVDINNDGRTDIYTKNILDNNYTVRLLGKDNKHVIFRDIDSTQLESFKNIKAERRSKDSLEQIMRYNAEN